MGDTIQKPGGDSGVVRVHGTEKAVAATVDSSAVYCWAHPLTGGKQVVAESWRNLISVGAKPIAITNCLNFGNPEKEKNMSKTVIQEISGSVSQITLNRPDSLNAIDHVLASELRAEILLAEMNKEVRCVVLKGAGAAFMAGGDIRAFSERIGNGVDRYMLDLTHDLHDAIIAIRRMPKPVLASVHGAAAGAGFSIAMAACTPQALGKKVAISFVKPWHHKNSEKNC